MSKLNTPTADLISAHIASNPSDEKYRNYKARLLKLAQSLASLKDMDFGSLACEHYCYVYLDPKYPGKYSYINPSAQAMESMRKAALLRVGVPRSPEAVAKTANANRGRKNSPQALANIRAGQARRRTRENLEAGVI